MLVLDEVEFGASCTPCHSEFKSYHYVTFIDFDLARTGSQKQLLGTLNSYGVAERNLE